MDSIAQQSDLKHLAELLQERLRSLPQNGSFLVRCALKDETLIVLSQHPAGMTPGEQATFAALEQALQSMRPQVAQPVQMYLRVAGEKQPYAAHNFTLEPEIASADSFDPFALDEPAPQSWEQNDVAAANSPAFQKAGDNCRDETAEEGISDAVGASAEADAGETAFDPFDASGEPALPVKQNARSRIKLPLPLVAAASALGLAALIGGGYLLTRPCVVGGCERLENALAVLQQSRQAATTATSPQQLTSAGQRLTEAAEDLQPIPSWSPRYGEAQQVIQSLSADSQTFNSAATALSKASAATQKSQQKTRTTRDLQATAALWKEAIAPLEAIPANSAVSGLAKQKLPQYRAALNAANKQLNAEQQAVKKLAQSKAVAETAAKRSAAAQTLQNWQQAQTTWQVVVNALNSIPKTSASYQEAQQLLANYRPKLAAVRDRTTQERLSAFSYNQALTLANIAKRYEQQNQLAGAVSTWISALDSAQNVLPETFYYTKAQELIQPYTQSLKQAQDKQKVVGVFQKARADLGRTCSGSLRICNYSLNNQGISVRLTSGYEQALEQSTNAASAQGDAKTISNVVAQYQTLQRSLEIVSDNTNLPLEVYDSKGTLIYTYASQR